MASCNPAQVLPADSASLPEAVIVPASGLLLIVVSTVVWALLCWFGPSYVGHIVGHIFHVYPLYYLVIVWSVSLRSVSLAR